MSEALKRMEGGSHYLKYPIQPIEMAYVDRLEMLEGTICKHVMRHRDKNQGIDDLKKAIHYTQMLLEWEYGVLSEHSYQEPREEVKKKRGEIQPQPESKLSCIKYWKPEWVTVTSPGQPTYFIVQVVWSELLNGVEACCFYRKLDNNPGEVEKIDAIHHALRAADAANRGMWDPYKYLDAGIVQSESLDQLGHCGNT